MARNTYWTYWDAEQLLADIDLAIDFGDFHGLTWNDAHHSPFSIHDVSLGSGNASDFAVIYLQQGALYDFLAYSDDWHPEILIYDADGWLLSFDDPDDLVYSVPDGYGEDSIEGFIPEHSGYYYLELAWEFQHDAHGLITIEVDGYGHRLEPVLLDDDAYHWNAGIVSSEGLYVSPEEAQLYRAYLGALGRLPDWEGFRWWSEQIEDGHHDLWSMAQGFIWSDEFRWQADDNFDGRVSDAEFVSHMYEGVFGRSPDLAGFDYWMSELYSGRRDQVDVFVDMTQSNEYVELTLLAVSELQVYV